MNALHFEALAKLGPDWRPLPGLRANPNDGSVVFDDLVVFGKAEVKRDPVTRSGVACGERTFYRAVHLTP